MKCFFSYIIYNLKWTFAVLFCGLIMVTLLVLNRVPADEIWYAALLCGGILLLLFLGGFHAYRKKYRVLLECRHSVTVSLQGLPETRELIEAEYRNCLELLYQEKTDIFNEMTSREHDLTEYYTMWVHQIKTPIAALKLLLEERDQSGGMSEELQELFRIEQYVEMALQYMRLGSESTDFVLRRVALDDIIKEAIHKYARQFIRKKIKLNYEQTDRRVLTDEKWLEFVIEQLLSNALKYTAEGSISIYVEEGRLVIADTGIGIRSEDLPRVCEKGYTGYNGHSDKRSTGIGLYLCNSILKKLGHKFDITSEEGVGTRVSIGFCEEQTEIVR